jgi:hypothetical protein
MAMLLSDARRRQDKKNAKRLANRKSASSSRERKKTLVKEMTELNAKLKRQALILALLPDLVIVIDINGAITFCSAQVERVMQHKVDDLVGEQLSNMLVPSSRARLTNLMKELLESEKSVQAPSNVVVAESDAPASVAVVSEAVGSDPSFPLSVVKVQAAAGSDENSDLSVGGGGSKQMSSLTNSDVGNSGSDGDGANKSNNSKKGCAKENGDKQTSSTKDLPSSDTSNSSSLSTSAQKLQKANANLVRNVRCHNQKMKDKAVAAKAGFRDDVIGADVTANNATARLSSLRHRMESPSEEDSGYRESNDSREETSSSASDLSDLNGKKHAKNTDDWMP